MKLIGRCWDNRYLTASYISWIANWFCKSEYDVPSILSVGKSLRFCGSKSEHFKSQIKYAQWTTDSIWTPVWVSGVGIHLCSHTLLLTIELVSSQWLCSSITVTTRLLLNECVNEMSFNDGSSSLIVLYSLVYHQFYPQTFHIITCLPFYTVILTSVYLGSDFHFKSDQSCANAISRHINGCAVLTSDSMTSVLILCSETMRQKSAVVDSSGSCVIIKDSELS
jgi:hypothetical protein